FEYALAAGITCSGADAYLLHVTTTPSVSYAVRTERFDCGVMISASHNPYEDNGVKVIGANGEKADDALLDRVETYLDGDGTLPRAVGEKIGRTVDYVSGRNRYMAYLLSLPVCSFRGYRVGLDCANGSAWTISKSVFDALGAQTYVVGAEPNGINVNAACGSTHPERLRELVLRERLDVGFAFDGDADRCICIDERGRTVDGDGILYACASYLRDRGELGEAGVVATVMSNYGLALSLRRSGIDCTLTKVGDRFVYEEMVRRNAMLGGEQSGHVIFRKYATTGDGILTAVKTLEVMAERKSPLSLLTEGLKLLPHEQRNVRLRDRAAALADDRVLRTVSEWEKKLAPNGRFLMRKSGTEPLVRLLAEGEDEAACRAAIEEVERALLIAGGEV
ncbi:MAG: phosphoglucosamine mutase, partial [Candidatus Gallimonas sp.]